MIKIDFKHTTKCPICGKTLVIIDNYNYMTMICPKCHTTVFEEFNHTKHVIKNGIMEDGYNVSLDIFYKQFIAYSMYANSLSKMGFKNFWNEKAMIGVINNEDIMADGIYNYFIDKINNFKIKQPCMYFKGYELYLEMAKTDGEKFKNKYSIREE